MNRTTELSTQLKDPSLLCDKAFIDGRWIEADTGHRFDVINPARGDVISTVPELGVTETRRAIAAAKKAQRDWKEWTGKERAAMLKSWTQLMIDNAHDLAMILTAEMGKPLAEAEGEILYGASFFEWFSEEAKRIYGETIPAHQRDKRIMVIKQAVGVVGVITPWNFPNAMLARKVAPALAAGCAVVCKPAAETPLSALAIAELAQRAGLPAGLLNIITSTQSSALGKELTSNPDVRKITFTGSTRVGRLLLAQSANQIQKVTMELGGNAPFIVFDDADLDAAVEGAMMSKYRNNGQTCVCANRIYVQNGIYDTFASKLASAVKKLHVGDGFDQDVSIGPMISQAAVDKVEEHLEDAVAKGAKVLSGGAKHELGGTFYQPTVIINADRTMKVATDETFGPFAPLFRFEDEADVIEQANDTIYGLASYFYANDLSRIIRVYEALEYGIVGINTGLISTELAPFGGVKQSGIGREGSRHGIDDYLEMKYLCIGFENEAR